jgi:hypothetical protein
MGDRRRILDRLFYLAKVYLLGFMLTCFFILPMLARLGYTTSYDIPWNITENILPPILWPFAFLAIFGVTYTIIQKEYKTAFLLFSIVVALVFFYLAPTLGVVDIRFLPFIYLTSMLLAAYGLSQAVKGLKGVVVLPLIVVLLTVFWVNEANMQNPPDKISLDFIIKELTSWRYKGYTPSWIKWNYEGFEGKGVWPQYKATNDYMNGTVNDPRARYPPMDSSWGAMFMAFLTTTG